MFDEAYGRDHKFLDELESLDQAFVGEVPADFHGWAIQPIVRVIPRKSAEKRGRQRKARVVYPKHSTSVKDLLRYSPSLRDKSWQRYRIKDTDKGPVVWEIKHCRFWRKIENPNASRKHSIPSKTHCLLIARNVETDEIKYFVSNIVPGRNGATVRDILRLAFSRWSIEACFRTSKEELGLDHFEVRGWRSVHRHWYVAQLAQLFCSRIRQEFDPNPSSTAQTVTIEQIRSAVNVWLATQTLPSKIKNQRLQEELERQKYYQRRNETARRSHYQTRIKKLMSQGIAPDKIKSCIPKGSSP